jgi:hypothetical protein
MIEVELPDGSIAEFPDGTPPEAMKNAIAKRFPRAEPQAAPASPSASSGGVMRTVDDFMRGAADTASFGFSDEIAARAGALTGIGGERGNYDANVAAERARDAEGGWTRVAGQVAGALTNPMMGARSVMGAIGSGALNGAAYGFGSGDGTFEDRRNSAALGGAVGGAAGGLIRAGTGALANRAARKAIPTEDQLKAISKAGYEAADAAGVIVKPQGAQRLATSLVGDLADWGYHPALQPRIKAVLDEAERLAQGNVTFKGLDQFRRIAKSAAASNDPSEAAIGSRIVRRIEAYMTQLPPEDVLTGNAAKASAGMKQGQDYWARFRRSEMVDTAKLKAERRADSSGTGGNLDNTIRQNVRAILDSPKKSRGMTAAEKEMAEKVVRGTTGQNLLRQVGRLSPTTGGLSAMLNVGATMASPYAAIPGAIGLVAKGIADRSTTRNATKLLEMIRSGGMTAQELVEAAARGEGPPELVAAIRKMLANEELFRRSAAPMAAVGADRVMN